MAIIKCDDVGIDAIISTGSFEGAAVTTEEYVEQNEVTLGKKLLAVESDFFTDTSLKSPLKRDVQAPFLTEKRPSGISDQFRAEFGKFWVQDTSDKESAMVFLNWSLENQQAHEDWEGIFAPTVFELEEILGELIETSSTGSIGLSTYTQAYVATAIESRWGDIDVNLEASDVWTAYVQGTKAERGSFSRPTPLIPADDSTFTDHAFKMNTPFSKKELEMFANISDTVKFDVADVESDYDFFAKAYEEGIAPTNVPENALPHLYTEVQRGESGDENTDKVEFEAGYFREWINTVLSNQDTMNDIAEDYENVAILDSVVDEDSILDSENKTTSAFEILMAYANRENLFPMNVNIEVGTNEASNVMFEAEDVGMVDDIVEMLMGDGDVTDSTSSEDFADYGDWNWDGMDELGDALAEQGNVDYSLEEEEEFEWTQWKSKIKYDFGKLWGQGKWYTSSWHDNHELLQELKGWNITKHSYRYAWPEYPDGDGDSKLQSETLSPLWEQIEKYIDDNSGGFGEETVDEAFYYSPHGTTGMAIAAGAMKIGDMKVVVEVKEHKGIVKLWCYFWEEV
jgi:hypothetical protein